MSKSKIEWTETTWNPVTGCNKVSPGCKNCYAERMAKRLKAMRNPNYRNGFQLTTHEHMLDRPLTWRKPQRIFVNSMSDLFHPDVPFQFIEKVFDVMRQAHWHQFQVLTKRPERMADFMQTRTTTDIPPNIWLGTSVENRKYMHRIDTLRNITTAVRFLSLEPLLDDLGKINLNGIHWVIVGGESGPGARPIQEEWVLNIKEQCHHARVPFFFKQWGGVNKKSTGRKLMNQTWDQMPKLSAR